MAEIDKSVFLAKGSIVTGDVTIGPDCGIWYNAVVRGDEAPITIGRGTNVQDNAVIHIGHGIPTQIGERVTIGHTAIVHGCTVGDDSMIGMGAIVMNRAVIGKECIIAAGALVTEGKVIPDGSLAMGSPAKVVRELTAEERAGIRKNAETYIRLAAERLAGGDEVIQGGEVRL